jgi:glutamate dehydrogenase
MTDDIAALVLRDNYFQTQVLSVTGHIAGELLDAQQRFIQFLEKAGRLRRALEFLPSDDEFAERRARRLGLTSPERAVLLAFSKIWLNDELLASPLLDDPWVSSTLERYFPKALRARFAGYMSRHPLKREIIATHVTNSMLNRVGSTFVHRVMETTGARPWEIVRAFLLNREIFGFVSLWKAIEALDNRCDDAVQASLLIDASRLIDRGTMWFLRSRRLAEDMAATIAHFAPRVDALAARLPELQDEGDRTRSRSAMTEYAARGVPETLAARMVALDALYSTLDIVEVAGATRRPVELVAEIYFGLSARLGLPWLRERIARLPGEAHWQMLARGAMHDDLSGLQRTIAGEAVTDGGEPAASDALLAAWQERNRRAIERVQQLLAELRAAPSADAAMLSVALRELRNLA